MKTTTTTLARALAVAPLLAVLAGCSPSQQDATADRLAILETQNRYVIAMDYFDADGYAAVFTEDGVLDWARGEVIGREAIREFMATGTYDLRKLNFQPAQTPEGKEWPPAVRHIVTNQVMLQSGESGSRGGVSLTEESEA